MQPSPLPRYKCHKEVSAVKIREIQNDPVNGPLLLPIEEGIGPIQVNETYLSKHKPEIGGYFVLYEDGYQSFSPAKAFEDGYTRVEMNALELGAAVRAAGLAGE